MLIPADAPVKMRRVRHILCDTNVRIPPLGTAVTEAGRDDDHDAHIAWAATTGEHGGTAATALREALWSWFGAPLKTTVPITDRPC